MWAHPGKQLLFMGGELAEWGEWSEGRSLDWPLLDDPDHAGVQRSSATSTRPTARSPRSGRSTSGPEGFAWLVGDARDENVIAFARFAADGAPLVCVVNFSPDRARGLAAAAPARRTLARGAQHRLAVLRRLRRRQRPRRSRRRPSPLHGQPFSALVTLPPLATVWLVPEPVESARPADRAPAVGRERDRASAAEQLEPATSSAESPLRSRRSNAITTSSSARARRGPRRSARRRRHAGSRDPAAAARARAARAVEVTSQRRPLDPDGGGEVVLRAPRGRLQVREHEPDRNRAAGLGELSSKPANRLGGREEPKADGVVLGRMRHRIANAAPLIIRVLIMCRRTIQRVREEVDDGRTTVDARDLGCLAVVRTALDPALGRRHRDRDPRCSAGAAAVVRAASRRWPGAARDPGRALRPGRDRRGRVPGEAGHLRQ